MPCRGMLPWTTVAALLLALLPTGTAAGQAGSPAAPGPYAAEDAAGQAFAFDRPVARIVCLQTGCDEVLADLGLTPVASAITEFQGSLPIVYGDDAERVAFLADRTSVEEVAAYEPELIVTTPGDAEGAAAMEAVAPVFTTLGGFDAGPEQYEANIRDLGTLTGRTREAEAAIARFRRVLDAIAARAPADAAETRFVILFGSSPDTYFMPLKGSMFCNLLEARRLGGCVIDGPPNADLPFAEIDAEAVLAADPGLIGYVSREGEPGIDDRADATWDRLTAVREGRVYVDASDGLYCCGLRHVQYALELYAHHAFPEAGFPAPRPFETYDPASPVNPPSPAATPAT